jgi:hypothetical protein
MKLNPGAAKQLEKILEQELSSYTEYLALLAEEQNNVVGLKPEKVAELSHRRSEVVNLIRDLRDQRITIVSKISGNQETRLGDFIRSACSPTDAKKLDKIVTQIKAILSVVESKSREFSQVLNFSLGLVNGEISLLWSASQPVTRVYNAFGSVTEATQPGAPRSGSLLSKV